MKRIISLTLVLILLFSLAACNGGGKEETVTTTIEDITFTTKPTTTKAPAPQGESTTGESEQIDPNELPSFFPEIPSKGVELVSTVFHAYQPETADLIFEYNNDHYEINLRCSKTGFNTLASKFSDEGWLGNGFVQDDDEVENSAVGYWRKNGWAALVTEGAAKNLYDGFEYSVTIDVIKCSFKFPTALEKYFPAFNGYSPYEETYFAYDTNGIAVREFTGAFIDPSWCWEFRRFTDSAFIGVTKGEIEEYLQTLYDEGFNLYTNKETTNYGTRIYYDAVKIVDERIIYSISMCYTEYLMLFEAVYSNDLSAFFANGHFEQEEQQQ